MIAAVMLMLTFTVGSSAYWEEEGFFAEDILLSESVYYYVMYDEEANTYAEVAGYETDDEGTLVGQLRIFWTFVEDTVAEKHEDTTNDEHPCHQVDVA